MVTGDIAGDALALGTHVAPRPWRRWCVAVTAQAVALLGAFAQAVDRDFRLIATTSRRGAARGPRGCLGGSFGGRLRGATAPSAPSPSQGGQGIAHGDPPRFPRAHPVGGLQRDGFDAARVRHEVEQQIRVRGPRIASTDRRIADGADQVAQR